jgi:succinate dehydrogenase/fumarate reductase cytochrome b subunit
MHSLATRQAAYIAAVILAGIVYVATGHQFNGAWLLMAAIGAAAITDTHTTTRRNHS